MKRNFPIGIAAGWALGLTAPVAAQNASQPPAAPQPPAPMQAVTPQPVPNAAAVDPTNVSGQSAQATDAQADPKPKPKPAAACTPITAGPNQGQFIGKCRHRGG